MDSYNFDIIQGSTFSLNLTLRDLDSNPIDLTNYNVSGFVKNRYSDSGFLTSLNPSKTAPYASGVIALSIAATGTSVLPVTTARYDIEIYHTGLNTVDKVLNGFATIYPEVTR